MTPIPPQVDPNNPNQANRAALPLITSGYFDQASQSGYDLQHSIMGDRRQFAQQLRDYGLIQQGNSFAPQSSAANPYGAWQQGVQQAQTATLDAGVSTLGPQANAQFAPVRNEITKQAARSLSDMRYENQSRRLERHQILGQAKQNAARFGVENEMWMPPKAGGK